MKFGIMKLITKITSEKPKALYISITKDIDFNHGLKQ